MWVADMVDETNRMLGDRNLAIGPSHFMKDVLDERRVKQIWERSIVPYIEDNFLIPETTSAPVLVRFATAPVNALIQLVEHKESDPVTLSVEERDRITRLLPKATITPVPGSSDSYTINPATLSGW